MYKKPLIFIVNNNCNYLPFFLPVDSFSQVAKVEQQIIRQRVKKGYTVPIDSKWIKQWSLVSLVSKFIIYNNSE